MDDKIIRSIILLTYKGKVLLMCKSNGPIDEEKHPWSLISGVKKETESFDNAISRCVEEELGVKIGKIEYVSDLHYHAKLTDDNVNKIERVENQAINFFTFKELKKLFLSKATEQFISKHSALI